MNVSLVECGGGGAHRRLKGVTPLWKFGSLNGRRRDPGNHRKRDGWGRKEWGKWEKGGRR